MKTRSCKNKGVRLQNEIRLKILNSFPQMSPDDCECAIMGQSGVDIKLSNYAKQLFPYSVEAKNQEKINVWSSIQQAEDNCQPNTTPLMIFKRNRSKTYVVLDIDDFMKIVEKP
jgi:hypothetical protein